MAGLEPEFKKRNVKIIGLSVDPVTSHSKWIEDIQETQGHRVNYPMIGDPKLEVAKLYNMLPAESGETSDGRTAATNATVRTVFVVGPDKKIKLMLSYPMSTGRNFDEVLRVLDSMQLTASHKVATPVNWKNGEDVIILPSVTDDEAKAKYPNGWKSPKPFFSSTAKPPSKRCISSGRWACGFRWTTSARDILRLAICAASRSTRSRSTAPSSTIFRPTRIRWRSFGPSPAPRSWPDCAG